VEGGWREGGEGGGRVEGGWREGGGRVEGGWREGGGRVEGGEMVEEGVKRGVSGVMEEEEEEEEEEDEELPQE
jgi:hypothetical protein